MGRGRVGLREEGGEECGVEGLLPTSKSITKVSKPVYTICIHVCKHTHWRRITTANRL